jgi:hypothetical protein
MAIGKEKPDSSGVHNALLHRKTLLVIATGDLEDVALEFVTNAVARNLLTHSTENRQLLSRDVYRVPVCESYLLSMNTRNFRSSSISISFWLPLAGCGILSVRVRGFFAVEIDANSRRRCSGRGKS